MRDNIELADKPVLRLERRLGAPPRKVFDAWTRPREIALWFGPAGAEQLDAEVEPRAGGSYRIGFRTKDGARHEVGGTYLEFVPGQKLAFTWAWHTTPERESLVTIELAPDAEGTRLTLRHERFFDAAARDRHGVGWCHSLDRLAALFS
jgi:uncharacterized protein YndB with AHSA1/START domain